ncbi:uncharacterized protein LOC121367233 [Gigantopelta aegis]|uniref:uncharacterized protein LOC121367233 n=1 Tax=Gigantopelta aegis TaxID=1735272 RepID=UPI001B88B06D|nr:uncharacterized protein LOC121367233 [Gigantopelta aegis]
MQSIILAAVLCLAAVNVNGGHRHHLTFADFMKHVQSTYDLTDPNLLLLGELVVAADDHTLKAEIDRLGFENVVKLLQHLNDDDAHYFENYLFTNLGYSRNRSVNKRARFSTFMHWLDHYVNHDNDWFDDLPHHIQRIFKDVKAAAQSYRLQQYTDTHTAEILELMTHLSGTRADEFDHFLIKHLEAEKAMAAQSP